METINYAKWDHRQRSHHARYVRHVNAMPQKLVCQECGGDGQALEDIVVGHRLYIPCGWCEGTGLVTRWMRGMWLRLRRRSA